MELVRGVVLTHPLIAHWTIFQNEPFLFCNIRVGYNAGPVSRFTAGDTRGIPVEMIEQSLAYVATANVNPLTLIKQAIYAHLSGI